VAPHLPPSFQERSIVAGILFSLFPFPVDLWTKGSSFAFSKGGFTLTFVSSSFWHQPSPISSFFLRSFVRDAKGRISLSSVKNRRVSPPPLSSIENDSSTDVFSPPPLFRLYYAVVTRIKKRLLRWNRYDVTPFLLIVLYLSIFHAMILFIPPPPPSQSLE